MFIEDTNYLSSRIQEHADKQKNHLKKAEEHGNEIKKIMLNLDLRKFILF